MKCFCCTLSIIVRHFGLEKLEKLEVAKSLFFFVPPTSWEIENVKLIQESDQMGIGISQVKSLVLCIGIGTWIVVSVQL